MVGYCEETKGYNLFYTSILNTFIERSVQFEEEIIPDFELAPGEFSSPQHHDDSNSDFFDNYDNEMDGYEIYLHDSPSRPKCTEKTIQDIGDLVCNLLDPRKPRSQFHNASYESEITLVGNCYMMIGSDPQSYKESFHDPRWK